MEFTGLMPCIQALGLKLRALLCGATLIDHRDFKERPTQKRPPSAAQATATAIAIAIARQNPKPSTGA
jgi:hypothetical protein